jgi:hypothetical protein
VSEWRPIATAPKDGTRVLIADSENVESGRWSAAFTLHSMRTITIPAGWDDDRYDAAHTFEREGKQPTHWMPLPEPPK